MEKIKKILTHNEMHSIWVLTEKLGECFSVYTTGNVMISETDENGEFEIVIEAMRGGKELSLLSKWKENKNGYPFLRRCVIMLNENTSCGII